MTCTTIPSIAPPKIIYKLYICFIIRNFKFYQFENKKPMVSRLEYLTYYISWMMPIICDASQACKVGKNDND